LPTRVCGFLYSCIALTSCHVCSVFRSVAVGGAPSGIGACSSALASLKQSVCRIKRGGGPGFVGPAREVQEGDLPRCYFCDRANTTGTQIQCEGCWQAGHTLCVHYCHSCDMLFCLRCRPLYPYLVDDGAQGHASLLSNCSPVAETCEPCEKLGAGAPSAEINTVLLPPLVSSVLPSVVGGPINPAVQFISGAFFLMRESELSWAWFGSIKMRGAGTSLVVSWMLPASITDPCVSSVSRSCGCRCSSGPI